MLGLFTSGGWLMYPILVCSVIALGIIGERFWVLRETVITPERLVPEVLSLFKKRNLNNSDLQNIHNQGPLGTVIAKGLTYAESGADIMKLRMEEQGRHVVLMLERYLNALGTIAAVAPLIGLLGTVMGMIQVFAAITVQGTPNVEALAGGISQALLTTAFGLLVAIPSIMFHRHFHRKIDELACRLEQESLKFVESIKLL